MDDFYYYGLAGYFNWSVSPLSTITILSLIAGGTMEGGAYYTNTIGRTSGRIVSGTKTVSTAGSRVQITTTSIPMTGVWLAADTGNTNPVVVGDSSVVAAAGSEQGILLFPGNPPMFLPVTNLNMLWVDSQTNGDKLCYAYLQPA